MMMGRPVEVNPQRLHASIRTAAIRTIRTSLRGDILRLF